MAEFITAARPYAKALYESAGQANARHWLPIMEICRAMGEDKLVVSYLSSPNINSKQFSALINSLAKSAKIKSIPEKFNQFIQVLAANKRYVLLPDIAMLFIDEMNKSNDTVIAEIVSAKPLTDDLKNKLLTKLEAKFDKKVEASVDIDPSLIGGAVIRVGDTVIDGSVKGRLEQLTKALN